MFDRRKMRGLCIDWVARRRLSAAPANVCLLMLGISGFDNFAVLSRTGRFRGNRSRTCSKAA